MFGLLYAFLGAVDFSKLRLGESGWRRAVYFCIQGGLLLAIFLSSRFSDEIYLCVFCLVVATVMLSGPVEAALIVIVLFAMIAVADRHFYGSRSAVSFLTVMIPAFAFVVLFTRIAMKEKAARKRAELLSAEVDKLAVIRERNRLAREIHDGLGHYLTTIHVQLQAARTVHATDPVRALEAVAKAQALVHEALGEVRRSVGALQADRPLEPLAGRLRGLASATDGWGATVSLETLGEARTLPPEAEHALFRAVQEGLTNVRRHAQAHTVLVGLDFRDPARVFVRVTDDGRGPPAGPTGHGLAGLRERFAALGGSVVAEANPAGGFCLQVEIPA
jgi:signal transduction histidine kinase